MSARRWSNCATPRSLATVGRFVQVANFKEPPLGQAPDANAMVAASACRAAPAYHGRLVAAAYRSGHDDNLQLVLAVIDSASGQVGPSFKADLDSDPAVKLVSGSLWLDTSAYDLAPGVRAFGLDVTTGLPRGCAGVGSGARRTLFVSQGRFIRPVLQDLPMSEWALIQRGRSQCTDSSAPDLTITENFTTTLGLAPSSTRGYRDLVVTGSARARRRPRRRTPAVPRGTEVGRPHLLDRGTAARLDDLAPVSGSARGAWRLFHSRRSDGRVGDARREWEWGLTPIARAAPGSGPFSDRDPRGGSRRNDGAIREDARPLRQRPRSWPMRLIWPAAR